MLNRKKAKDILINVPQDAAFGFPMLSKPSLIPVNLVGFNKSITADERILKLSHIHFFLDDYQFERLWNAPSRYLKLLSRARGVIGPDFTCYVDAPLPLNIWQVYRNRVLDWFLQSKGIDVIPTLVWGGPETWDYAFAGIPTQSMVAVGAFGCLKKNPVFFIRGFEEMVKRLDPQTIIVYGDLPDDLKTRYADKICNYVPFAREKWNREKEIAHG